MLRNDLRDRTIDWIDAKFVERSVAKLRQHYLGICNKSEQTKLETKMRLKTCYLRMSDEAMTGSNHVSGRLDQSIKRARQDGIVKEIMEQHQRGDNSKGILERWRFQQNETFLWLMLWDTGLLVQQFNQNDETEDCFEKILRDNRILSSPTDGKLGLYHRVELLRMKTRSQPKYFVSFNREFKKWESEATEALYLLPDVAPIFSKESKQYIQRRVLYHLRYTVEIAEVTCKCQATDHCFVRIALVCYFHQTALFIKDQIMCFGTSYESLTIKEKIKHGLKWLRSNKVPFGAMSDEARSTRFLLGGMPSFLFLFNDNMMLTSLRKVQKVLSLK